MLKIESQEPLTVVFCANDSYAAHLGAALCSLLENNVSLDIEVVVLAANMTNLNRVRLQQICEDYDVQIRFELVSEESATALPTRGHLTASTYLRLLIPELVSARKCLYLDSDLIVRGSVAELTELELDGYFLAAVENPGFARHASLGMHPDASYFNAGVMLINLDKWRQKKVKDSVYEFVLSNEDSILYMDQCGLNAVVNGQWIKLPLIFNFQTSAYRPGGEMDVQDPVIVHFTGSEKPWLLNYTGPFKREYWRYRNKTLFKSVLSDDFGARTVLSRITPRWLKNCLRALFRLSGPT